jgi:hypothetical protein
MMMRSSILRVFDSQETWEALVNHKKMAQKGVIEPAVHDPFVAGITHILLRLVY